MELHSELTNKIDFSIFGKGYEMEEVFLIPNMLQNSKYWSSPITDGQLVDIITGDDGKLIFVWKRSPQIKEVFDLWCKREL